MTAEPINFEGHFDPDSTSVQRARETESHISDMGDSWLVAFRDSESVHEVELEQGHQEWRGTCWTLNEDGDRVQQCPGYSFHDGPCAHLWLVRSQAPDLGIAPLVADGGHVEQPPAGSDGRVFGRPEGRI